MAIHNEQTQEIQGFAKEIEQSAIGMILDNLQQYQYQYPQKSTIRELVSNSIDAILEKQNAYAILTGKAKVEDFYITRQEDLYKDSNFDPSYYDLNWLWTDVNKRSSPELALRQPDIVYVTYVDGGEREKDKIMIEDYGVGLGGRRLEGYFKVGFSTKRNSKKALGKFGIGAKAALSTAPYYVMTTRYNGREFKFQVHPHTITPIVPPLNLETGELNPSVTLSNNAVVHYKNTLLPNGTIVEIESKKHYKQLYIDAVKSQLLYFDNVEFRIQNNNGGNDIIPVKANILYEDDYIVLSDNKQYSKPHMLINKVNYGNIDFRELELEDMEGNIGVKVDMEEVTVNPSRESLIWNEHTRKTVIESFQRVVDIASNLISKEIQETDFIKWLRICAQIQSRYGRNSDSILGRLACVADLSHAKIQYAADPSIFYNYLLLLGIQVRHCTLKTKREGSTIKYIVKRESVGPSYFADIDAIYLKSSPANFRRDKYLLETLHPQGFLLIDLPFEQNEEEEAVLAADTDTQLTPEERRYLIRDYAETAMKEDLYKKMTKKEFVTYIRKLQQYITSSTEGVPYESVIVPDDFDSSESVEEKTEEEKESMEQRRKLEGTFPMYTPRVVCDEYRSGRLKRNYEWQKIEVSVSDIDNWKDDEIYYASDKPVGYKFNNREILESDLLHMIAHITRPRGYRDTPFAEITNTKDVEEYGINLGVKRPDISSCTHFFTTDSYTPKVKLVKVSQDRVRYVKDFSHAHKFFMQVKGKTLTMSSALLKWNTARLLKEHILKLQFLNNFEIFHRRYYTWYKELKGYIQDHYRTFTASDSKVGLSEDNYKSMVNHCDKVFELQKFVRDHKNEPDLIAQVVKELFNPEGEINDGAAVDMSMYDKLVEMLDWSMPVSTVLNEIKLLTVGVSSKVSDDDDDDPVGHISPQLEHEIRLYLEYKGVPTE